MQQNCYGSGIPDDAIIGALHIKTIHLSEVKEYYLDYFGLEQSAYMDDYFNIFSIEWLLSTFGHE